MTKSCKIIEISLHKRNLIL